MLCIKWSVFPEHKRFLFRPRVFRRVLGAQKKCGSRPDSVARAPGVQSRQIWQVTTGSLSAERRRADKDNEKIEHT